jgi:hypothetical protein
MLELHVSIFHRLRVGSPRSGPRSIGSKLTTPLASPSCCANIDVFANRDTSIPRPFSGIWTGGIAKREEQVALGFKGCQPRPCAFAHVSGVEPDPTVREMCLKVCFAVCYLRGKRTVWYLNCTRNLSRAMLPTIRPA